MSEITINIVEASSEIAHDMAKDEMFRRKLINNEDDMHIEDEHGMTYTEAAQEVFNNWYDYVYNMIEKTKVN